MIREIVNYSEKCETSIFSRKYVKYMKSYLHCTNIHVFILLYIHHAGIEVPVFFSQLYGGFQGRVG